MADIAEMAAGTHGRDAAHQALVGDLDQPLGARSTVPAPYMRLESPCQPSRMRRHVDVEMSPSRSGFSFGMPWQTTWLIEVQLDLR